MRPGRLPHRTFRGLLDVHSRYGLPARRATVMARCLEGSGGFVTSTAAPIATGWSDPYSGPQESDHRLSYSGGPVQGGNDGDEAEGSHAGVQGPTRPGR